MYSIQNQEVRIYKIMVDKFYRAHLLNNTLINKKIYKDKIA